MKILLNYDPESGWISDDNGMNIICWTGLSHLAYEKSVTKVVVEKEAPVRDIADKLAQLRMSGFQAEDIVKMKEAGVL